MSESSLKHGPARVTVDLILGDPRVAVHQDFASLGGLTATAELLLNAEDARRIDEMPVEEDQPDVMVEVRDLLRGRRLLVCRDGDRLLAGILSSEAAGPTNKSVIGL